MGDYPFLMNLKSKPHCTDRQWHSHWGVKGSRVPPLTVKNLPKIGKKREKTGKIRKGKNWEGSFTLPLRTDRAGCTTADRPIWYHS